MIQKFINICNNNNDKVAFKYIINNKVFSKNFNDLLNDVYRFCNLFKEKSLKKNDKVILFILPSYELYTLMIAGMMYGLNIVVIDDFKDKKKVELMVSGANGKYVFVNKKTKLISKFIFKDLTDIDVSRYYKYNNIYQYSINKNDICLTTFTSGTTGIPKVINRSFSDLEKQVNLLYNNFSNDCKDTIICMLPIYVLFSLFNGNTTCIIKKLNNKNIKLLNGNVVLGKIANVLDIDNKIVGIKKLYLGGAYIYKNEAKKILDIFEGSEINYIYGASECVVIGINNLKDFYENNRFKVVKGMNVSTVDNVNDVGEIVINGESVLTNDKYHLTGDIGKVVDSYLYIYGRKKYSSLDNLFYNYLFDEEIRNKYNIDKAFTIWYENKTVVFVNDKCNNKEFIKVKKFPYDLKHKTKVDYNKLIDKYLEK